MKKITQLFLIFLVITNTTIAQNVAMNMLTQNNGLVDIGGTVYLEVTVSNTNPSSTVGNYRLKPLFTIPNTAVVPATGHILPTGWTILNGLAGQPPTLPGQVIRLSNGTSTLPPNTSVTVLIALQGVTYGPSSTITGALQFSNGVAPGTGNGTLAGNSTGDDNPTATVEVTNTAPITLTDFRASLQNCVPTFQWITEQEINSNRFELQRTTTELQNNNWITVASINAAGTSTTRKIYSYKDINFSGYNAKQLYRLKMVDNDGSYKYSKVLSLSSDCNKADLNVYPNPAKKVLNVSVNGFGKNILATIKSNNGQIMVTEKFVNGTNNFDVSAFAPGIYLLSVMDNDGLNKQVKVTIQN